jgi:hypothetical protein
VADLPKQPNTAFRFDRTRQRAYPSSNDPGRLGLAPGEPVGIAGAGDGCSAQPDRWRVILAASASFIATTP